MIVYEDCIQIKIIFKILSFSLFARAFMENTENTIKLFNCVTRSNDSRAGCSATAPYENHLVSGLTKELA